MGCFKQDLFLFIAVLGKLNLDSGYILSFNSADQGRSLKTFGVLYFRGFPMSLGIFLCILRLL